MEVFQLMRSAGVRPNLHTYTTVMNLYANVRAPRPRLLFVGGPVAACSGPKGVNERADV